MKYWQSHNCNGYRAEVTIEWTAPEGVELLPDRDATASGIAEDALAKIASAPYELVQVMQGRSPR